MTTELNIFSTTWNLIPVNKVRKVSIHNPNQKYPMATHTDFWEPSVFNGPFACTDATRSVGALSSPSGQTNPM